jgi:restriction endonuclease Mrr
VDLIIESTAETLAVQCKDSRAWTVGVRQIGEFEANLLNHRIQKGVFVTLTGCTADAKQLARKNGIQILEEADILEMLVESGLVYDHRIAGLLADELVHS